MIFANISGITKAAVKPVKYEPTLANKMPAIQAVKIEIPLFISCSLLDA
jgi:hypothetical protein